MTTALSVLAAEPRISGGARGRAGRSALRTVAPAVTRSMHAARDSLKLTRLWVIHAGKDSFALGSGVEAIAARRIWTDLRPPR